MKKHITFDPSSVKDYHEKLALNIIREKGVISSSELIKITNLNKSTVFSILKELSAKELIVNAGKGDATDKGGVRPQLWDLNGEAFYSIGIDIEIGELTAVILDLKGETKKKKVYKVKTSETVDELVETIVSVLNNIITESGIEETRILGCCIAFTGIVDAQHGIIIMSGILFDLNLHLFDKLKNRFPFPVLVENNANAAAIGERWIGQAKNKKNFMLILIELDMHVAGLGIGIVLEGDIYRGASYSAGELYPHMPNLRELIDMERPNFPNAKILKDYISGYDQLDIYKLIDIAKQGDEVALLIFSIFGRRIGEIISPAVALLNPDTLIISGNVAELDEIIMKPIATAIQMNVLAVTNNVLKITLSKNLQYSVAMGAASLILYNFFRLPATQY